MNTSSRFHTLHLARAVLALLLLSTLSPQLSTSSSAQGDLTPPGPPAPTMKTLTQVEPRTPIESLPFTISQSGSYYFTKNLQFTAASGHAITIAASDVTLDLMGFTLSSVSAVNGDAIRMNGGLRNIAIKNGVIAGNTTVTVTGPPSGHTWTIVEAGFRNGIGMDSGALHCHFSHLRISGCRVTGMNTGNGAVVEKVTASENGTTGIFVVNGSAAHSNVASNGGSGFDASASSLTNCTAVRNQGTGIFALNNGSVTNSIAKENGGRGIQADTVVHCSATQNSSHGIDASSGTVTNCFAENNGGDGIFNDNGVVAFCKASANDEEDIDADGATRTGNNPAP